MLANSLEQRATTNAHPRFFRFLGRLRGVAPVGEQNDPSRLDQQGSGGPRKARQIENVGQVRDQHGVRASLDDSPPNLLDSLGIRSYHKEKGGDPCLLLALCSLKIAVPAKSGAALAGHNPARQEEEQLLGRDVDVGAFEQMSDQRNA